MKPPQKNEIRKPSKTLAGVTPIAVMAYPKKCRHGACLYCPSLNVPQSYTPKSPPVLRAELLNYSPSEQVKSRLNAFSAMHHPTDKIELIIMGGNFPEYNTQYKLDFVKSCYDALNNKKSKTLEEAKKINETAKNRCVALCIESRPDTIAKNPNSVKELLNYGCTRVELGVQCLDDVIYRKINRHHTVADVANAVKMLKNAGFKVGCHMMLGLPYSTPKKDVQMFKKLFSDSRFKPDQLKIYPCQVIKGAKLVELFKKKKYKPYTKEQIQELIIKIMQVIPNYCRVMRIMREIPPEFLVAGTTRIDLRKDIDEEIRKRKLNIQEIRFREVGFALRDLRIGKKLNQQLKLKVTKYPASSGAEYFLEIVNRQNILFGLCRLRINEDKRKVAAEQVQRTGWACEQRKPWCPGAFIRELHVYGQSLPIGARANSVFSQHRGLGKMLLLEAEKIAKKENCQKLYVISGVGVREYYRKLGYSPEGEYMARKLWG